MRRFSAVLAAVFILLNLICMAFVPVMAAETTIDSMVVGFPVCLIGESYFTADNVKIKQVNGEDYTSSTPFVSVSSVTFSSPGPNFTTDKVDVTVEFKTTAGHRFSSLTYFTPLSNYVYQLNQKSPTLVDKYTMRVVYTISPSAHSTMTVGLPEFRLGTTIKDVLNSISVQVAGQDYKKVLRVTVSVDGVNLETFFNDSKGNWQTGFGKQSAFSQVVSPGVKYDAVVTVAETGVFIDKFVYKNPEAASVVSARSENLGAVISTTYETGSTARSEICIGGFVSPKVGATIPASSELTCGWYYNVVSSAIFLADGASAGKVYACEKAYKFAVTLTTEDGYTFSDTANVKIDSWTGSIVNLSDDKKTAVVEVGFPALEHPSVSSSIVPASCLSSGVITSSCVACGTVLSSAVLPAIGHVYSGGICELCGESEPVETTSQPETTASPSETKPQPSDRKNVDSDDDSLDGIPVFAGIFAALLLCITAIILYNKQK